MGSAVLQHGQYRAHHSGGGGNLLTSIVDVARQGVVVAKQLVSAVDEMDFHGGSVRCKPGGRYKRQVRRER